MIETIKSMYASYDTLQSVIFTFFIGCVGLFSYFYTRAVVEIIKLELFKR